MENLCTGKLETFADILGTNSISWVKLKTEEYVVNQVKGYYQYG
jgi:hypothetical protein